MEEYQRDASHSTMDKAIFTALSSTQIVDGFFLKETRDLSDTIEYLVGLHETILELHQVSRGAPPGLTDELTTVL